MIYLHQNKFIHILNNLDLHESHSQHNFRAPFLKNTNPKLKHPCLPAIPLPVTTTDLCPSIVSNRADDTTKSDVINYNVYQAAWLTAKSTCPPEQQGLPPHYHHGMQPWLVLLTSAVRSASLGWVGWLYYCWVGTAEGGCLSLVSSGASKTASNGVIGFLWILFWEHWKARCEQSY